MVRGSSLTAGDSTSGIVRSNAFELGSVLMARSRVAAGVDSGWHHHGRRTLYGFLVSDRLRLETGPSAEDSVELNPGDSFRIPFGLVHRDVNPDRAEALVVVNVLVGDGVPLVNVEGPQV